METVNYNGTDYPTLLDGGTDLRKTFQLQAVTAMGIDKGIFEKNVVAYHTDSSFKSFVDEAASSSNGAPAPTLMLVSFGGPGAVHDLLKSAKSAGLVKTQRAAAKSANPWRLFAATMTQVGWSAMEAHFNENREAIYKDCAIPEASQAEDFRSALLASGKGTLAYAVERYEVGEGDDKRRCSIAMSFRLDENSKAKAKSKAKDEDSGDDSE